MQIRSMLFTEADVKKTSADAKPSESKINSPITEFYHTVQLHIHHDPVGGGVRFEREPKIHVDNKKEAKKKMKQVGMKATNYSNTNKQR